MVLSSIKTHQFFLLQTSQPKEKKIGQNLNSILTGSLNSHKQFAMFKAKIGDTKMSGNEFLHSNCQVPSYLITEEKKYRYLKNQYNFLDLCIIHTHQINRLSLYIDQIPRSLLFHGSCREVFKFIRMGNILRF